MPKKINKKAEKGWKFDKTWILNKFDDPIATIVSVIVGLLLLWLFAMAIVAGFWFFIWVCVVLLIVPVIAAIHAVTRPVIDWIRNR